MLPSANVAVNFHVPEENPAFVSRLKCHWPAEPSVSRNWFPVVAASVATATTVFVVSTEPEHLVADNV